jgi:hypothetical protein
MKKWESFPTAELRDAFMVFMIDLLGKNLRISSSYIHMEYLGALFYF